MKSKLIVGVLSAVFALALTAPAEAVLVLTGADADYTTLDNSGPGTDALLALAGLTQDDLLYKGTPPSSEEGDLTGSYDTTYNTLPPAGDQDLIVDYVSGDICADCWLLVKDGAHTPASYLFDLSGWNGTEQIQVTGLYITDGGGISHIGLYSATGETTETTETILTSETTTATLTSETTQATVTPEPATLALLGSGLAIAAARLRRRKKV